MSNEDGTVWVTFNGEIYNFPSLREELLAHGHKFQSNSDTEVIVHGYEQWGIGCVERLRGIFAFGLWDQRRRKLWLVRDHLGVKPLYYYQDSSRLIFASEVKAIVADDSVPRRINSQALSDYLSYGYIPFDRSIYEGVCKLPPGYFAEYSNEQITLQKYWDVPNDVEIFDEQEAILRLKDAMRESVSLQKVSDVPLGIFLSGGIDSSAVTAYLARESPHPETFTVGFDEENYDETKFATRVARHCGTKHVDHHLAFEEARALIPSFVEIYDEPFADTSGLPTYLLSQFARARVKVALAGDGGDELFAGYRRYDRLIDVSGERSPSSFERLVGSMVARPLRLAARRLPLFQNAAHRYSQAATDPVSEYFLRVGFFTLQEQSDFLTRSFVEHLPDDDLWLFKRFWQPDRGYIKALQYLDLKTYLPDDILTKVDRASMAHGLEVRVPLLDHKLVELCFKMSSDLIYSGGERKHLLKQSLADLLPNDILSTRKKGFGVPLGRWFEQGLGAQARASLRDGSLVTRGILKSDFERHFPLDNDKLWLLYVLELWSRRWLEGESQNQDFLPVGELVENYACPTA